MPQMTITLSKEIDDHLNAFARRYGVTKAEAMRRAFALLVLADRENQKGEGLSLGIVRENENHELVVVSRVVGIFGS